MLGADVRSRHKARRGLAIFFAIVVPLSAIFEVLVITTGDFSWLIPLVLVPALASVVARLVLREGFSDVSFRLGGRRGWSAIALALVFPIVVGLIAYGIAWVSALARFAPRSDLAVIPYLPSRRLWLSLPPRLPSEPSHWPSRPRVKR